MESMVFFSVMVLFWVVFTSARMYREKRWHDEGISAVEEETDNTEEPAALAKEASGKNAETLSVNMPETKVYAYGYAGDVQTLVKGLEENDYSVLDAIEKQPNDHGLWFLDEIDQKYLKDEAFLQALRRHLEADPYKPLNLYRKMTESRKIKVDGYTQYIYIYRYVILMPDNQIVTEEAPREYSPL